MCSLSEKCYFCSVLVKPYTKMKNFAATAYTLKCVATEHEFEDAGWTLEDRECEEPSLIRAI